MTTRQQQDLLDYLGYPCSNDGEMGPKTAAATAAFVRDYGLEQQEDATQRAALVGAVAGTVAKPERPEADASSEPDFWKGVRFFRREEFRCPCGKCGGFPVEPVEELVLIADDLRDELRSKMIIVPPDGHSGGSGVRCPPYNATFPNSVSNSRHLEGKAIDFSAPEASQASVEAALQRRRNAGKIRYWYRIAPGSWHMDIQ